MKPVEKDVNTDYEDEFWIESISIEPGSVDYDEDDDVEDDIECGFIV